jgi:hypothetical protein
MTTNNTTRTAALEALTKMVAINSALIAATTDAVFDVELAADAILAGAVQPDTNDGVITDELEALAFGAMMSAGAWWVSDDTETTRVHSLGYLAEMCGSETTEAEARLVRDALIDRDLLDWSGDAQGGDLHAITDEAFFAIVASATTTGADLMDADTGDKIGAATPAQIEASLAAGDTGIILIDADGDVVDDGTWAAQQPGVRRVWVAL